MVGQINMMQEGEWERRTGQIGDVEWAKNVE
jgi:hypothetical protein